MTGSGLDDFSGSIEHRRINNRLKSALRADPHRGVVDDAALLQLERDPVPNIVADVFFVDENLVHRPTRPGTAQIGRYAAIIEFGGNLAFIAPILDKALINPPDDGDLF